MITKCIIVKDFIHNLEELYAVCGSNDSDVDCLKYTGASKETYHSYMVFITIGDVRYSDPLCPDILRCSESPSFLHVHKGNTLPLLCLFLEVKHILILLPRISNNCIQVPFPMIHVCPYGEKCSKP